jgi:hypothetical protein
MSGAPVSAAQATTQNERYRCPRCRSEVFLRLSETPHFFHLAHVEPNCPRRRGTADWDADPPLWEDAHELSRVAWIHEILERLEVPRMGEEDDPSPPLVASVLAVCLRVWRAHPRWKALTVASRNVLEALLCPDYFYLLATLVGAFQPSEDHPASPLALDEEPTGFEERNRDLQRLPVDVLLARASLRDHEAAPFDPSDAPEELPIVISPPSLASRAEHIAIDILAAVTGYIDGEATVSHPEFFRGLPSSVRVGRELRLERGPTAGRLFVGGEMIRTVLFFGQLDVFLSDDPDAVVVVADADGRGFHRTLSSFRLSEDEAAIVQGTGRGPRAAARLYLLPA